MPDFNEILNLLYPAAAGLFVYATIWWLAALKKRDNSIVDISWGPGIFLATLIGFFASYALSPTAFLIVGLVALWAFRLAAMIAVKNYGRGEDPRYAAWRKQWAQTAVWRSYLQVFLLQAALMLIICLTPLAVMASSESGAFGWWSLAGVTVFVIGLFFETVGDYQLYRFKQDRRNKGKLMTSGLWQYTRHPNYFGEACAWLGIGLAAVPVAGWWAAVAPVVVLYLVRFLSGVPIAERHYADRKDFAVYQTQTNTFVPWIPKR